MLLICPHCSRSGEHVRSDFFGDWVVCSVCELPFAWREAQARTDAQKPRTNGRTAHPDPNRRESVEQVEQVASRAPDER